MTPDAAPRSAALLGGRYRLGPALGAGGMAAVHRAQDMLLGREVAIKVYRSAAVSQEDIDQQEAEIRTIAGLNHPGLVTVLDAGVYLPQADMPTIFLVMELLRGENLHQRILRAPLTAYEAALVGYDIATALTYLAEKNVVHRDIKPGNIMLVNYASADARLYAKLIDFGVASRTGQPGMTTPGATTGTAPYLSPEQASGEAVSPASDVYSLGLVLLEALTGTRAFPGDSIPSAVARLMRDPEIPRSLPGEWRDILSAMTARDPADRPELPTAMLRLRSLVVNEITSAAHRDAQAAEAEQPEQAEVEEPSPARAAEHSELRSAVRPGD